MNSRTKGKAGELEFAKFLRERGYAEAARGQQHRGGGDSPDVIGLPGIHPEVKRTERLQLYAAVDQSRRDAAPGNVPVVFHRCNKPGGKRTTCRGDWLAVISAGDLLALWSELQSYREIRI